MTFNYLLNRWCKSPKFTLISLWTCVTWLANKNIPVWSVLIVYQDAKSEQKQVGACFDLYLQGNLSIQLSKVFKEQIYFVHWYWSQFTLGISMAVGFAIATTAFLATFGKYFSKRWFFWFISAVIATIAGMLMNAGNKKQVESTATGGAPKKDEAPAPSGQGKPWHWLTTCSTFDDERFTMAIETLDVKRRNDSSCGGKRTVHSIEEQLEP